MDFLDTTNVWTWCREHGVTLDADSDGLLDDPALVHRARLVFAPNGPSGLEPPVATAFIGALGAWDECLVWITGWGVWPSSEDWPRYYALRGRHGERRSIDTAPGHLIHGDARTELHDLLVQIMTNGWDAAVLPACGRKALPVRANLSHDGWLEVRSSDAVALQVEGLTVER